MTELSATDTQFEIERVEILFKELSKRVGQLNQAAKQIEFASPRPAQEMVQLLASLNDSLEQLRERVHSHEKEREQLRALQAISGTINSSLDLAEVLRQVMDAIIDLTGAERGFLMLTDEESGALDVQVARNMDRETIARSSFDISRSIVEHVAESGEPVVTINAQTDPRFSGQESIISYNLRSILCVPLKIRDRITGVIYADNRIAAGIFGDRDRDLLATFANQAAVAIANARLFQRTREQLADITEMKNLMDDVFASIASGVITVDTDDRVALFNRAAERILGLDAADVLGRSYQDVLSAIDGFAAMVEQVKAEEGQHTVEVEATMRPDDGRASLSFTFSPLWDMQEHVHGVAVVVEDLSEKKRLESVRRYLPPALVEQVRDLDAAGRPQRRFMSVLFGDVRGYSTISEQWPPEELVEILNGYFSVAANVINRFEGVIDKYMGDAFMAEFNTTLNPQEDHIERAARTALLIREEIAAYHEAFPPERRLHFGMGIHSGESVVGNVGTHFRKDYSVIGDAVNLAKRLQEVAEPDQILVTHAVCEQIKDWAELRFVAEQQLKGRDTLERIYELVSAT
ncbi:MAG: adenylate/guanylate cyclase domain-containing protein [Chloroflexota bacterium]